MESQQKTMFINSQGCIFLLTWITILSALSKDVGATCNTEQVSRCIKAAEEGSISSLSSAGKCQAKQYVEFSHICFVKNYLPTVDHCCCVHETTVFCCRYHQNWNTFRCNQHKDVIGQVSAPSIPLHIIIPIVIGALGLGTLLLVCLLKRWCFRYDEEHESHWCGLCDKKKSKKVQEAQQTQPVEETVRLNSPQSYDTQNSKESMAQLLPQCSHDGSIQPSAPPIEELDETAQYAEDAVGQFYIADPSEGDQHCVPAYSRSMSQASAVSGRRSSAATGSLRVCPSCSSAIATTAPPTYDESRNDPVLP